MFCNNFCNPTCSNNCCCIGPRGATGPTGPTGPANDFAFGGRFNTTGGTVTLPAATVVQLTLPFTSPENDITYGTNNLIIEDTGYYHVTATIIAASVDGTVTSNFGVRVNTVFQSPILTTLSIGTLSATTIDAILQLDAGDILDLAMISTAGGTFTLATNVDLILTVTQIG